MVHDKSGLPQPLPFLRALGMETVWRSGDSQCGGGSRWGKDPPAAEELSLPLMLLLGLGVQGPYSLEAVWTMRSITPLL